MNATATRLRAGLIKRLHVNQAIIKSNTKNGTDDPTLTIQTSKGPLNCHEAIIICPHCKTETARLKSAKPLSCGARVWIETKAIVETILR